MVSGSDDDFIFELMDEERSAKKKARLQKLQFSDDEWTRVGIVREIFEVRLSICFLLHP